MPLCIQQPIPSCKALWRDYRGWILFSSQPWGKEEDLEGVWAGKATAVSCHDVLASVYLFLVSLGTCRKLHYILYNYLIVHIYMWVFFFFSLVDVLCTFLFCIKYRLENLIHILFFYVVWWCAWQMPFFFLYSCFLFCLYKVCFWQISLFHCFVQVN